MSETRLSLTDSGNEILLKMAEGNPGAINVLIQMISEGGQIDPDSAFGGLSGILSLDSCGIYGTDIYILHSDICDRDMVKTLGVLRAVQLGLFTKEVLKDACHRQDRSGKSLIPVDDLLQKVKDKLPEFGKIV